jgi:threonine aldolase
MIPTKKFEIDLRSDTVTRPGAAMRTAMASAEVGDDVFGDDPSVLALQEQIAGMLGKEAALFTPSGSMANQIAIRLHCRLGDEFLCEANCHIQLYEQGGYSQLSGAVSKPIIGKHGVLELSQLPTQPPPEEDHLCRLKLLALENTHNRGGGTVQPLETVQALCQRAKQWDIATHLDGARLFNAVIESGVSAQTWAANFDTVNICFSKGLGAPVGSALVGSREQMREAKRIRKLFGGGMRQVGLLAAAASYALNHHIDRLAEDHANAKLLAQAIEQVEGLRLDPAPQTNIVICHVDPALTTPLHLVTALQELNIGIFPFGPEHVRFVTHLDVSVKQTQRVCQVLPQALTRATELARGLTASGSQDL